MAYDLTGKQTIVLRGGAGLFFDRPFTAHVLGRFNNPPTSATITAAVPAAADLGAQRPDDRRRAGLTRSIRRSCRRRRSGTAASRSRCRGRCRSTCRTSGSTATTRSGRQHQRHRLRRRVPAAESGSDAGGEHDAGRDGRRHNLMRAYRGYGNINLSVGPRLADYHSIQLSFERRFQNGLSFGFNDTIGLSDKQQAGAAPAARRRRLVLDPRRSGRGRRAPRPRTTRSAHHARATSCGTCPTCKATRRG